MRRMGMGLCLGTRERAAVAHVEDVDDKAQARGLCVCLGGGTYWGGVGWGGGAFIASLTMSVMMIVS